MGEEDDAPPDDFGVHEHAPRPPGAVAMEPIIGERAPPLRRQAAVVGRPVIEDGAGARIADRNRVGRAEQHVERARDRRVALARHVRRVLFNPQNPEGDSFRSGLLDHLTPAARAQRRVDLLAEAAAWSPSAPGWGLVDINTRTLAAEGRFGGLYSNLFFERGLKLPRVYVEVD